MAEIKLSPDQLKQLGSAERQLEGVLAEIDKAESCDIDCEQYRALAQEARQRLEAMRKAYGPKVGG